MTTVLVVDDSRIDRDITGGFVEEAGFQPLFAKDGVEALAAVAEGTTEIVLTDMRMPEMDGLELVRRMREQYPKIPVILMTGFGSEETAISAMKAGAAHYVPKANLHHDLRVALHVVSEAMQAVRESARVRDFLESAEARYVLGYERGAARALVSHLQASLTQLQLCPESDLVRVGAALTEALSNAVDHGNLELDSTLREESHSAYAEQGRERRETAPYCDRRVHVTVRLTQDQATFVVRDEGHGFDVSQLPDPTDPENITKCSGRGVMLMRMFMDEVRYNDRGNEVTMVMKPDRPAA